MSNLIIESGADGSISAGNVRNEAVINQSRASQRNSFGPIEWKGPGEVLGFYSVAQQSGAIPSIAAGQTFASIRWTDPNHYLVLMRLRASFTVASLIGPAGVMDAQAVVARTFSPDFASFNTQVSMAAVPNTNKFRVNFGQSLLGTAGPQISTTAAMTVGSFIADAAPFAMISMPALVATNMTGTSATLQIGLNAQTQELYSWTALGSYPIVLGQNEGIAVQVVSAGPTTGAVKYEVHWEWGEVRNI